MTATESLTQTGFVHEVVFYDDDDDYLGCTVPFILEGLKQGESVLVAVPSPRLGLLRPELESAVPASAGEPVLALVAMEHIGANPARIIPAWSDFLAAPGVDGRVRGVGEPIYPGRSEEELVECHHHEALLNLAFPGREFTLRCPYDRLGLDPAVIETARATHPVEVGTVEEREHGVIAVPAVPSAPLPAAPETAETRDFTAVDLSALRVRLRAAGLAVGLSEGRVDDLEVAVTELVANSIRHGGGGGRATWWADGRSFYCEIVDRGRLEDPLAGRRRPGPLSDSGRGLWIVQHLCDLVQMRSLKGGCQIRLRMLI